MSYDAEVKGHNKPLLAQIARGVICPECDDVVSKKREEP